MAVEFKPVSDEGIDLLISNLRVADIEEIKSITTKSALTAIKESVNLSEWSLCAYCEGELLAVFGLSEQSALTASASPWMIGTNAIYQHKKEFWKASIEALGWMKSRYDYLENSVHVEHKSAIAWLRRLGFSFDDNLITGRDDSKFMRFYLCVR